MKTLKQIKHLNHLKEWSRKEKTKIKTKQQSIIRKSKILLFFNKIKLLVIFIIVISFGYYLYGGIV